MRGGLYGLSVRARSRAIRMTPAVAGEAGDASNREELSGTVVRARATPRPRPRITGVVSVPEVSELEVQLNDSAGGGRPDRRGGYFFSNLVAVARPFVTSPPAPAPSPPSSLRLPK
jgi:hypothetical protein